MAKQHGLIPGEMIKFLNYRINQEEFSSRLYYAMYEWLEFNGYTGAAKMIKEWSCEEMEHAQWAREFLREYDLKPEVQQIDKPNMSFESLVDVIEKSYDHEVEVNKQCQELYAKTLELSCTYAIPLALKYLEEQADEISKVTGWLDRLELVGTDKAGILLVDQEMGG